MTKLSWAPPTAPRYESGVDRGVLYYEKTPAYILPSGYVYTPAVNQGVAWNGLASVSEGPSSGSRTPYHFEGIKYTDIMETPAYQATIKAFSFPIEFAKCIGEAHVIPGFVVTRQQRMPFGFSYRTLLGDNLGYKIHLVYNATAASSSRKHETRSPSSEPNTYEWTIDAVPPPATTYRPAAHLVIDSTKTLPAKLTAVENILYGQSFTDPRLPNPGELITLLNS